MSAPTAAQVEAVFAHLPAAEPVVLSDRRKPGADVPTVPVDGWELDREQVACALFERLGEDLNRESCEVLLSAVSGTLRANDWAWVLSETETFRGLSNAEFPEVLECRILAHRLCLAHWYRDATARPMTAGEVAAALYVSDLDRVRRAQFDALPRTALLVSRALHEGAQRLPAAALVELGEECGRELTGGRAAGRGWLYRQVMPDYHRRTFCFDLARRTLRQPTPLVVRPNSGGYVLGLTAPVGPVSGWYRPTAARW